MQIELIGIIITPLVTLLAAVCGLIANTLIQRKNNSITVIVKKRLERRDRLQALSASIMNNSDVDYLSLLSKEERVECFSKITSYCSELRSILEFSFKHDKDLVNSAIKIKNDVFDFLNGEDVRSTLEKNRKTFAKLLDLYITTEWQRIKNETVGQGKKGGKSYTNWKTLYEGNVRKYEDNEKS